MERMKRSFILRRGEKFFSGYNPVNGNPVWNFPEEEAAAVYMSMSAAKHRKESIISKFPGYKNFGPEIKICAKEG